jgi:hypothetical protein
MKLNDVLRFKSRITIDTQDNVLRIENNSCKVNCSSNIRAIAKKFVVGADSVIKHFIGNNMISKPLIGEYYSPLVCKYWP